MKMYYAHPMSWYGTPDERLDIDLIEDAGWSVENPGTAKWDALVQEEKRQGRGGMQPFIDYIKDVAAAVAVRPFRDGRLGAGVAQELMQAILFDKPVYILGKGPAGVERLAREPNPRSLLVGVLSVAETRARIKRGVL